MQSPKRLARVAGVLYLILGIFSGFAILYVRPSVEVPGDAAATVANIVANETLFRLGFAIDLVGITCYLLVAVALFALLKHVNKNAAVAMVVFVAVAVAIQCLNMLNHIAALRIATDASYAATFDTDGAAALVQMFLQSHTTGFQISQVFFGLWLLPFGYLAYRSGYFPRALGILLVVGGVGYLVDLPTQFLFPGLGSGLSLVLAAPSAVAELSMVGYLLVRGVRTPRADLLVPAAA